MTDVADNLAKNEIEDFAAIEGDRGTWESHWEEVSQRVMPAYSGWFQQSSFVTPGSKKNQNVYDSTAPIALGRFAAVMESLLTPRNQRWHRLSPLARELRRDRGVMLWMDEVTDILFRYRYAPGANFTSQNHQFYRSLGAFGTGTMFVDDSADGPGMRYKNIHLGEAFLFENHQGVVDKLVRRFKLTARQARQWFNESDDRLPEAIKNDESRPGKDVKKYEFLHVVKPRQDVDIRRADALGMRFASFYIARDAKMTVRQSGYNTFPYNVGRYDQAPNEVYGRSPAMEVLPAIKTLNEEKKTMLRQGHRALDPVLLAHDDNVLDAFSLRNGALNFGGVNADGRPLVHTLPSGKIQAGEKMMAMESAPINDAFLVTIFQILVETPQMTATEVLERAKEKGILLAPTMGRQQSERLGPMIDREIDICSRQGLLPPMPGALREAGGQYQVEYDSPLSRAARAEEASGFMRWVETGLKYAVESQRPEVLDWVNVDEAYPDLAEIMAVKPHWVNSVAQVRLIRANRQRDQERQQAVEAAPAAAGILKAVSNA